MSLTTLEEVRDAYRAMYPTKFVLREEKEDKKKKWVDKTRHHAWFVTLHCPDDRDWGMLEGDDYVCLEGQIEECPTTGRPHLQCVLSYKTARGKPIKKYPRAWMRPLISVEGGPSYCTKDATRVIGPILIGKKPQPGRRTDLEEVAKLVIEGNLTVEEVALQEPSMYLKYHNGIKQLKAATYKHRTEKPTVCWWWGDTGVGKTYWASRNFGEENIFIKDGTKWWDGYMQQKCVLIDDFDGAWPFRDFLRVIDRYRYHVQIKCGYMKFSSPWIVITSDSDPKTYFDDDKKWDQVARRLDFVREFTLAMSEEEKDAAATEYIGETDDEKKD